MVGKIAHLSWYNNSVSWSNSWTQAATLPDGIVPAVDAGFYTTSFIGEGSICGIYISHSGSIQVRTYGASTTSIYGNCTFICAQDSVSHDYVVDEYISPDIRVWSWRKWSSGVAECWIEALNTDTHYDTWLGGYCYYLNYDLPLEFAEKPCVAFSGMIGSGLVCPARHVATTTRVTLYYLTSQSGTADVYSSIMVKGRWK